MAYYFMEYDELKRNKMVILLLIIIAISTAAAVWMSKGQRGNDNIDLH